MSVVQGGAVKFSAALARDDDFVFEISDNGKGIPGADIPRTFKPFERPDGTTIRAQQGAGLDFSSANF